MGRLRQLREVSPLKHPDSGTIKILLSDINERIAKWMAPEKESKEPKGQAQEVAVIGNESAVNIKGTEGTPAEQEAKPKPKRIPGCSARAVAAVCVQIALENVGCAHYALRVLSRIVETLSDEQEKSDIIDKTYKKLSHQPNSTYCQLWLQNITYQKDRRDAKSPYSMPLCRVVANDKETELWNTSWLKPQFLSGINLDAIIDEETLQNVTPVITFRETRTYEEF